MQMTSTPILKVDNKSDLERFIDRKKEKTRRKKLPKTPRPREPNHLERRYNRELQKIVDTLDELVSEIVTPHIGQILGSAQLLRPDSKKKKIDTYVDDIVTLLSAVRVQYLRRYPDEQINKIANDQAFEVNQFNEEQHTRMVERVLGVQPIAAEVWLRQEVSAFTRENVKLIKSISDQHLERIEGVITRGAQAGKLQREIAREIKEQVGVASRRAELIARDQVQKFNGQLTKLRQQDIGIKKYRWSTSEDERVRPTHRANNHKVFSWNNPPATGHPGEEINCRCVAIAVFEDE